MQNNIFLYIAIMVGVTTLIRVLPLTLIQKEIKNRTLRSFLYYIPYLTLAVMTFPAILDATGSPISAWAACRGHCRCVDGEKPVFCVVGSVYCGVCAGTVFMLRNKKFISVSQLISWKKRAGFSSDSLFLLCYQIFLPSVTSNPESLYSRPPPLPLCFFWQFIVLSIRLFMNFLKTILPDSSQLHSAAFPRYRSSPSGSST